jgi:hypothetical protein
MSILTFCNKLSVDLIQDEYKFEQENKRKEKSQRQLEVGERKTLTGKQHLFLG